MNICTTSCSTRSTLHNAMAGVKHISQPRRSWHFMANPLENHVSLMQCAMNRGLFVAKRLECLECACKPNIIVSMLTREVALMGPADYAKNTANQTNTQSLSTLKCMLHLTEVLECMFPILFACDGHVTNTTLPMTTRVRRPCLTLLFRLAFKPILFEKHLCYSHPVLTCKKIPAQLITAPRALPSVSANRHMSTPNCLRITLPCRATATQPWMSIQMASLRQQLVCKRLTTPTTDLH